MDIQASDPKTLDVAHHVDSLSFCFYDDEEAQRLSVCRIVSPQAFDTVGRPVPRGLYDPSMGPTTFFDGPCLTCGQGYGSCPGHFGHIQLPFPIPNPLLNDTFFKLLRSSCTSCYRLKISNADLNLYLARLYLEDAGHIKCSMVVDVYRVMRRKPPSVSALNPNVDELQAPNSSLITNWPRFIRSFPPPLSSFLAGVDVQNSELIERNILRGARNAWKRALKLSALSSRRSKGWREIEETVLKPNIQECPACLRKPQKIRRGDRGRLFRVIALDTEVLIAPTDIERHIAGMWSHHSELLHMLFGQKGRHDLPDGQPSSHRHLFVRNILVPPSRFRPTAIVGSMEYAAEHPQNHFFQQLLTEISIIIDANENGLAGDSNHDEDADDENVDAPVVRRPTKARFAQAMTSLQEIVLQVYDSSHAQNSKIAEQNTGIRQQLESKTGLFRQHLMGKRVNFSARSVIGPDVFLDTDEIGIPESFAKLLSVPEPVTVTNIDSMRRAVLNGPSVYPGALGIEDFTSSGEPRVIKFKENASKSMLNTHATLLLQRRVSRSNGFASNRSRTEGDDVGVDNSALATQAMPKRVMRHLRTGDVVLFNRQPTLHRVSIMAHRVRVLPEARTIRFHYANCGSYNADFDGDEMNVHVPQDYIARAEAEELLLSSKHYIVPTSGAPVRGLIQDNIAAAALLSRKDTFLSREDFMQLLYAATENIMSRPKRRLKGYDLPMPALMKPVPLWTGKQLITAVLRIVRDGRPGICLERGTRVKASIVGSEEARVVIRKGELLQGVIDKSAIGSSMHGVIHAVQEAYGCSASDDFLSALGRLLLFYMRMHGHTTGVSDLELLPFGDKKRISIISEDIQIRGVQVANSVYGDLKSSGGTKIKTAKTSSQARKLIEDMVTTYGAEAEDRLDSSMNSMMNKTSTAVMKACVPAKLARAYPANGFALMTNTGAKGGAVNAAQISCLLGSTVLEGKRVPRMGGSGATLPCFEPYDPSPLAGGFIAGRFLTGISPQEFFFHAMSGREGLLDTSLKTANSGYLQRCLVKHLEGVRVHYDGTVRNSDGKVLQFIYGDDGIDPSKAKWLTSRFDWQLHNMRILPWSMEEPDSEVTKYRQEMAMLPKEKQVNRTILECVSPCPLSRRGAISEKFDTDARNALRKEGINSSEAKAFLEARYQAGAAEPGECVGVIASQGVGEPSTQLTLNTFHHAGSSSAHVTSGIPRLRELLMTASKRPTTPSMTLPVRKELGKDGAEQLRRRLQCVSLSDILLAVNIQEKDMFFHPSISVGAIRVVTVSLEFPEEGLYRDYLGISFRQLVKVIEQEFIGVLNSSLRARVRRLVGHSTDSQISAILKVYVDATKGNSNDGAHVVEEGSGGDNNELNDDDEDPEEETGRYDSDKSTTDDEKSVDDETKEDADIKAEETTEPGEDSPTNFPGATVDRVRVKKRKRSDNPTATPGPTVLVNGWGEASSHLGFKTQSFRTQKDEVIEFDWGLPLELCGRLNLTGAVTEAAAIMMLAQVDDISRCFLAQENDRHVVMTEGSNLSAMFSIGMGLIHFENMTTNDVFGVLNTYGVEAMRAALIEEIHKVFDSYGIPVDIRHLQLIADYMTAEGGYKGFNRRDMANVESPFQRMTFETAVKFLSEDVIDGTVESLRNPSGALALCNVMEGGTGGFDLLLQVAD